MLVIKGLAVNIIASVLNKQIYYYKPIDLPADGAGIEQSFNHLTSQPEVATLMDALSCDLWFIVLSVCLSAHLRSGLPRKYRRRRPDSRLEVSALPRNGPASQLYPQPISTIHTQLWLPSRPAISYNYCYDYFQKMMKIYQFHICIFVTYLDKS